MLTVDVAFTLTAMLLPARNTLPLVGDAMTTDAGTVGELWSLALGDPPEWTQMNPPGSAPPPLAGHAAVLDTLRRRMLVLALPNIWALDLAGGHDWSQLAPSGTAPVAWSMYDAVYDPVYDRVVLLGGGANGVVAYALNLGPAPQWQLLSPTGSVPQSRYASTAVYDARRGRILLTGGYQSDGGCNASFFSDLWSLQLVPPEALSVQEPRGNLAVSSAIPNPSRVATHVDLELGREGAVEAAVYDVSGRSIRRLEQTVWGPGRHLISWDGTSESGRRVANGLYFFRIAIDGQQFVRRVVRVQ